MTNDRNDRRRRPQTGSGRKPGGAPDGNRPRGSNPQFSRGPSRPDDGRRGFTPDSGYRPGGGSGGSGPNDGSRDRRWNRGDSRRQDSYGPRGGNSGGRPYDSPRGERRGPESGGGPRSDYNRRGPGSQGPPRDPRDRDRRYQGGPGGPGGRDRNRDYNRGPDDRRPRYGDENRGRPGADRGNDRGYDRGPAPQAAPGPEPSARGHKVEPFDLFCAYHLGITPDKRFRPANLNEVARRFAVSPGELKQALQDFGMDAAVVMEKEFDMAMAQLDMELAPEGIDRVELARQIYADFLEAPRKKIDWKKIIEEDIRENAKVFGRKD